MTDAARIRQLEQERDAAWEALKDVDHTGRQESLSDAIQVLRDSWSHESAALQGERDAAKEQAAWSTAWIGKIAAALTGGSPLETYDPARVEGSARRLVEKCDATVAACAAMREALEWFVSNASAACRMPITLGDGVVGECPNESFCGFISSTCQDHGHEDDAVPPSAECVEGVLRGKAALSTAPGARLLDMLEKAAGGLLLPGWFCRACGGTFNGEMKGPRVECRSCCAPREEKT